MRGHGGNVKKTGKRAAALLLSWVMALGGGSMPVMAEMVPGRETVREETEAGRPESPESGQTGPRARRRYSRELPRRRAPEGRRSLRRQPFLWEASTGTVIFEKNADEPRNPASVTKIMTLILIFDALQSGKIRLDDQVVTSAYAKSMGGSQVFLEEGEMQTVETLIKCIVTPPHRCLRGHGGVHRRRRGDLCADDERAGRRPWHGAHEVCGLLRPYRFSGSCDHGPGYCLNVPGTDHKISTDHQLFYHMDGKHHPCDEAGNKGVRPVQHQPAFEDACEFPGDGP